MRECLRGMDGQWVVLIGRLNQCIADRIQSFNICLKAIEMRPWRTDVAITTLAAVNVDHAWLVMQKLEHTLCDRVQILCCTAEVMAYTRRNGRDDFGFDAIPSICLDHRASAICGMANRKDAMLQLKQLLIQIQRGEAHFGYAISPEPLIHAMDLCIAAEQQGDHNPLNALKACLERHGNESRNMSSQNRSRAAVEGFGQRMH